MAETVDATEGGKKGLDFLKHKVGPLPVAVWLVIGVGLILYFKSKQAGSASASAIPNQQTDPAGNVGSIDPATGYVYGTPEDTAALAANNAGTGDTGSSGQTSTSGGQKYADNNTWGIAAINYLVGLGIDATSANQAITLYLSSQPLTTTQQGDVNLAIQALGSPPSLPGPVTGNPPPVTTPPGTGGGDTVTVPKVTGMTASAAKTALEAVGLKAGSWGANGGTQIVNSQTPGAGAKVAKGSTVDLGLAKPTGNGGGGKSVPAPTGLVVSARSAHSARIKWNRVSGATGYRVKATDMASKKPAGEAGVGSSVLTYAFGNLQASHSYVFDVWALPGPGNGPHAEVSATLPRS